MHVRSLKDGVQDHSCWIKTTFLPTFLVCWFFLAESRQLWPTTYEQTSKIYLPPKLCLKKPIVGDCPSHWMYYIPLFPNPFPHVGRCELIHKSQTFNPLSAFPRLLSATCLTWSRTQLALFARETQFWELSKQYKIANANTWETLVLFCKKTGSKLIYLESMPHLYWKGENKKAM